MFRTPASANSSYRSSIFSHAHSSTLVAREQSLITGAIRCGISLNGAISTTLGSIRISRTMSGRCVYMIDMMIVLMQTDLPDPVVPAIRQCGMSHRSVMSGSPLASLPR